MTTELTTDDALKRREIAEAKLATVRAEAEAATYERALKLIESPQPVVVPWTEYPAFDEFSQWPSGYQRPYYWTSVTDRSEGRYPPYYETSQDLLRLRAEARSFKAKYPVAEGIVTALTNYVIGSGFEFTVQAKNENDPTAKALVPVVQKIVDRFLERNDFVGDLDQDIHENSRVDGEAFPTLYPDGRKDVRLELVEPDCILQPAKPEPLHRYYRTSHKLNFWWHGVHTVFNTDLQRDDVTRPLGYHAVFDKEGDHWAYLPACRVEHVKRNVGRDARRGVSDFFIISPDILAEAKIRRNTAEGAAILAAIVMIREHAEGVTQSTIENMVANKATTDNPRYTKYGARDVYSEHVNAGTVKDIPRGMTHHLGPMGTMKSPVYIEVAQYLQRIMGTPKSMPEYLVSGDASNANYSSTLVSESPFVKAREHDQAKYARHFESIIWKALLMYYELGQLPVANWQQVRELLNVVAEYSSPASRDKYQQAQTNKILSDAGILSDRSFAADMDLDHDEEQRNIATQPKKEPPPMFGLPDGNGGPFGMRQPQRESAADLAFSAMAHLLESKP